jgi:hypothetical protein
MDPASTPPVSSASSPAPGSRAVLGGGGAMDTTDIASSFEARVAALLPLTEYGPEYNRGATSALADAHHFEASVGGGPIHFLLIVELRAKLLTFEEFEVLDWEALTS